MGPSGRFTHVMIYWTAWDRFHASVVFGYSSPYKGDSARFSEVRRVTRHPLVFHGFTGSQRTPGFWASHRASYLPGSSIRSLHLRVLPIFVYGSPLF